MSDGSLLLQVTAKQVQDITTLSRDVEHANNALSPIFNKEKEQKRLKQARLIGEIGAQVMDIVRTEGELKAQKAAEAKGDSKVNRPQDGDSVAMWEDYKKALTESPTYKAEMKKYGTGSDFQRAAQAATAAIQALAGGDIQKAIASGASPYLAQLVKDVTIPKDESKITASDIAANAMAHAVVGAVVAQLSGQDAAAGAIGASSGELAARAIMAKVYPGKTTNDLTEEEKQSVSALSTLASGLVSGLASNSTASAASGAQSGRNAVENNFLSAKEAEKKTALERKEKAGTLTQDEAKELADTRQLDKDRDQAIRDICTQGNKSGGACSALVAQAQQALNSYGESAASYRLIFKDLYPEDAANASAILNGLDTGSITRDAAITAIAEANNKDWNEVASQYDRVMQLHGIVSTLAGYYSVNSVSKASEATNTTMSMADRIKANVAESQKARESSNFDIHIAKSDQVQWGYKADEWGMVTLPAGSRVYGGIPGQSSYYTSWNTLLDAGFSRESIFKNLQVSPHPEFGYRPQMGIYEITNDIRIPSGQVMANPLLGPGGATQYFIKDYNSQLKLIDKIDLGK